MRVLLFLPLLLINTMVSAEEIIWLESPVFKLDIDCDGVEDEVIYGTVGNDFVIKVSSSLYAKSSSLQFGLGQASRQDAICGLKPEFSKFEADSKQLKELFGEVFEGYKSDGNCFDLNIGGGECDSINVFFNHKSQVLNWWRM